MLLIRFGAMGNALVAVPAIRALREAWPEAFMALVGDPVTLELLGPCPYLDELIRYDNKGPEGFGRGYSRFVLGLWRRRFTHAVLFRRHLRSELIGFFSGARVRVGFRTGARLQFLTHKVDYEEGGNVIEQNLKLMRALGVGADDRRLEYWPARDSARVEALVAGLSGAGPLVVMHPAGSTQRGRLWSGFAELARVLSERLDARIVMIGAEPERALVMETAAGGPAAAAIGLPLAEAAELIGRADLFAGTDSGPAHLADAVGTPGAILYAPHRGLHNQIRKWKPEGDRYLAFTPPQDCAVCADHPCAPERQKQCADAIKVEEVAAGLERLYAGTKE